MNLMKVKSLLYLETLSEEDVQRHQCSDRLWLPRHLFERWMLHSDPGVVVLLRLTNGVGQNVIGNVFGIHHGDEETIYVPSWILELLEFDHDQIDVEQVHPPLCSELTLSPHTSDHLHAEEPLELLRNAFENYSCLINGETYNLWLGDHSMAVTIVSMSPAEDTLCIRNCEINLHLLPPLDVPIPPPPQPQSVAAPPPQPQPVAAPPSQPVPAPAPEPALDSAELRRRMAEAARARLNQRRGE